MAHDGKGPSFKDACDDAWKKVPGNEKDKWYAVTEIEVTGNNPINQYRVVLEKKP